MGDLQPFCTGRWTQTNCPHYCIGPPLRRPVVTSPHSSSIDFLLETDALACIFSTPPLSIVITFFSCFSIYGCYALQQSYSFTLHSRIGTLDTVTLCETKTLCRPSSLKELFERKPIVLYYDLLSCIFFLNVFALKWHTCWSRCHIKVNINIYFIQLFCCVGM